MAQNNKINGTALKTPKSKKPLCKHTEDALDSYFASLNGDQPGDLYDLVLGEVERLRGGNARGARGQLELVVLECPRRPITIAAGQLDRAPQVGEPVLDGLERLSAW